MLAQPLPGDQLERTVAEIIAWKIALKAVKGDLRAAAELSDRTEGKVGQVLDSSMQARPSSAPGSDPIFSTMAMELEPTVGLHHSAAIPGFHEFGRGND